MEVHLDLIGGLAGDMFIAALLDAYPEHESKVLQAINSVSADAPVTCALTAFKDDVLQGRQFHVASVSAGGTRIPFVASSQAHTHTSWAGIRGRLEQSALPAGVVAHAIGIFQLLADAEAWVHGIDVERVAFHEVGAWDSIADIVGAATLIEALDVSRWSSSPVPLGSGRIKTAHGVLPVPAPATARLLTGLTTLDDGIAGERVTPTGAAILRYVCPPAKASAEPRARKLIACGIGFGSRALPHLSNHVRVLCFEPAAEAPARRRIEVLEFEVDDQSPEDLAIGLDWLRAEQGVLDVTQSPVFGKKGRMMMHVQVLARAAQLESVIETCFRETTTIGLRQRSVQGFGLERRIHEADIEGQHVRVKIAERPGGRTAKTESDDVRSVANHAERAALRQRAENDALKAGQLSDA